MFLLAARTIADGLSARSGEARRSAGPAAPSDGDPGLHTAKADRELETHVDFQAGFVRYGYKGPDFCKIMGGRKLEET